MIPVFHKECRGLSEVTMLLLILHGLHSVQPRVQSHPHSLSPSPFPPASTGKNRTQGQKCRISCSDALESWVLYTCCKGFSCAVDTPAAEAGMQTASICDVKKAGAGVRSAAKCWLCGLCAGSLAAAGVC
jgi:hypothetical protein